MSLGTGALKVSRVPDAIAAGRYPWLPWNAGNHPNEHPLAGTVTLKINGNTYPGNQMQKREGGEGASTELTPKQQYPGNTAPLSLTSNHHQFSPNKIDTSSRGKVLTFGRTRRVGGGGGGKVGATSL